MHAMEVWMDRSPEVVAHRRYELPCRRLDFRIDKP
jgi:hypothetical protein